VQTRKAREARELTQEDITQEGITQEDKGQGHVYPRHSLYKNWKVEDLMVFS
jgi:hypothetical protein